MNSSGHDTATDTLPYDGDLAAKSFEDAKASSAWQHEQPSPSLTREDSFLSGTTLHVESECEDGVIRDESGSTSKSPSDPYGASDFMSGEDGAMQDHDKGGSSLESHAAQLGASDVTRSEADAMQGGSSLESHATQLGASDFNRSEADAKLDDKIAESCVRLVMYCHSTC